VLVVSHKRPDGDAIGSGLALTRWAAGLGPRVRMLLEDGVPPNYMFIRMAREVLTEPPADLERTTLVVIDTTALSRVGECATALGRCPAVINIDHHPDNSFFGDVNIVDPTASAAALLIQELIELDGGAPDLETASLLYVGLLADTGAFRHSNVDARTMSAAARLVEAGADPHGLARNVFAEQPLAQVRLLGLMLSSMELHLDGRLALSTITDVMRAEAGACMESMEGLPGYGRLIEGVRVSALIREIPGGSRVSLRSNGDVDVRAVASRLGGGGHHAAAGVVLDVPVEEARRLVIVALEGSMGERDR
jgi:phosphoesterase RecJ-like protein